MRSKRIPGFDYRTRAAIEATAKEIRAQSHQVERNGGRVVRLDGDVTHIEPTDPIRGHRIAREYYTKETA